MDSKVLSLIPVIRDGKKVRKTDTLRRKVLQLAKPFCAAVKIIQGTWQVLSDKKGVIAIARKFADIGDNLPTGKEGAEVLDSIVYSALYDTLQNNADIYKAHEALIEGEEGLRRWTPQLRLAAYAATMSTLLELSEDIKKLVLALKARYLELMQEYGETLAKEAEAKKAKKE